MIPADHRRCQCRKCKGWFDKEDCLRDKGDGSWLCQECFMDLEADADVAEE